MNQGSRGYVRRSSAEWKRFTTQEIEVMPPDQLRSVVSDQEARLRRFYDLFSYLIENGEGIGSLSAEQIDLYLNPNNEPDAEKEIE